MIPAGALRIHPLLWLGLILFAASTSIVLTQPIATHLDYYSKDDAFYYLRTAEHIAAGHGSTFDGVNPTNGYQPAWMVILVAVTLIVPHGPLVTAVMLIQALCFAGGLLVLNRALVRSGVAEPYGAAAIGIVYVALMPVLGWDLLESGLTVLASSTVLLAFLAWRPEPAATARLALALGISTLVRLDHVLLIGAGALAVGRSIWRFPRRTANAIAFAYAVPILALPGAYFAWNLVTTGHVLPVNGVVKLAFPFEPTWQEFVANVVFLDIRHCWKLGAVAAVAIAVRDLWQRQPSAILPYAVGAFAIGAAYQTQLDQEWSLAYWYYVPLFNMTCWAIAVGLQSAALALRAPRRSVVAALALIVIALGAARFVLAWETRHRGPDWGTAALRIGVKVRELATPESRIAAWDSGIIGYYAGDVTNLDGLINSVEYFDRYLSRGRVDDYIREHRFDFIACFNGDLEFGGRAVALLDEYQVVFREGGWSILARRATVQLED